MSVEATIVVRFGGSVSVDALAVVELDERMNLDAAGAAKNEFGPGDVAWFLVHLDPGLYVSKASASAGSVQVLGLVTRERSQEIQLQAVGASVTLPYNPAGTVAATWWGRDGSLKQAGRVLTAQDAPAIGELSYQMQATQCRFIPPAMSLGVDEQYKVLVILEVNRRT